MVEFSFLLSSSIKLGVTLPLTLFFLRGFRGKEFLLGTLWCWHFPLTFWQSSPFFVLSPQIGTSRPKILYSSSSSPNTSPFSLLVGCLLCLQVPFSLVHFSPLYFPLSRVMLHKFSSSLVSSKVKMFSALHFCVVKPTAFFFKLFLFLAGKLLSRKIKNERDGKGEEDSSESSLSRKKQEKKRKGEFSKSLLVCSRRREGETEK